MKTLVKFKYLDSQGFKLYSTPQDFDMAMYKFLNRTRGIIPEREVEELKEKAKHLNVYSEHYKDGMWRQFLLDNGYRDIEIGIMKDGPIIFLNGYWCADFRTFNSERFCSGRRYHIFGRSGLCRYKGTKGKRFHKRRIHRNPQNAFKL